MKLITLKAGRDKSAIRRHPWIFSGAIDTVSGDPEFGESVEVYAYNGDFLGIAAYSPTSQIRARFWSFFEKTEIDELFFEERLETAIQLRESRGFSISNPLSAFRLIYAENDGIPGCIIDKYGEYYSVEILAAGPEKHREIIYKVLAKKTGCKGIFERCDSDVRKKEGMEKRTGVVYGIVPETPIPMEENGIRFLIDIRNGHKTGYYLDQRDARKRIGELSSGKKVLNCFCYTGGFGLFALKGNASHVYQVDVSKSALKIAKELLIENKLPTAKATHTEADVFQYLRKCRDKGETFDLIVLDPPKFVEAKDHLQKGARGYKDINLLAMKLLSPNGMLATFSCSGLMDMSLFQKIIADAASDAKKDMQIIERFGQPADHPISLAFPEGQYLKGLLVQLKS
ncbi:MAG: class I SAM-dependent methyltransferase [Fibrobacteraceae bacterium]|nr:class I SAM-dependent methyltransferase [Fibrobacteraceae bacterium]